MGSCEGNLCEWGQWDAAALLGCCFLAMAPATLTVTSFRSILCTSVIPLKRRVSPQKQRAQLACGHPSRQIQISLLYEGPWQMGSCMQVSERAPRGDRLTGHTLQTVPSTCKQPAMDGRSRNGPNHLFSAASSPSCAVTARSAACRYSRLHVPSCSFRTIKLARGLV